MANRIERLQVFGARCSGTNVFEGLLRKNLQDVKIMRTDNAEGEDNFGGKHAGIGTQTRVYVDGKWLRLDESEEYYQRYIGEDNRRIDDIRISRDDPKYAGVDEEGNSYITSNAVSLEPSDLLVVVYRNPLSWLQSVHKKPHHALELFNLRDAQENGLSFGQFLREPWRTYSSPPYMEDPGQETARKKWIDKGVMIEDEESVFSHRSASITVFEAFAQQADHIVYVHHEAVVRDPQSILKQIAVRYDIARTPRFTSVQSYKGHEGVPFIKKEYDPMEPEDLQYIIDHLDWNAEAKAGYSLLNQVGSESRMI